MKSTGKRGEIKREGKKNEERLVYVKDINKREDRYRQTDSESRNREKRK